METIETSSSLLTTPRTMMTTKMSRSPADETSATATASATTPTTSNHYYHHSHPAKDGAASMMVPRHQVGNSNSRQLPQQQQNQYDEFATVTPDKSGIGVVVMSSVDGGGSHRRSRRHNGGRDRHDDTNHNSSSRDGPVTVSPEQPFRTSIVPTPPPMASFEQHKITNMMIDTSNVVDSNKNNQKQQQQQQLCYRKNFGKDGIYVSPTTTTTTKPFHDHQQQQQADNDDGNTNPTTNNDVLSRARNIVYQRQRQQEQTSSEDKRQDSPVEDNIDDDDDDDDVPFDQPKVPRTKKKDDQDIIDLFFDSDVDYDDAKAALSSYHNDARRGNGNPIRTDGRRIVASTVGGGENPLDDQNNHQNNHYHQHHLYLDNDDDDDNEDNDDDEDEGDDNDSGIRDLLSISSKRALTILSPDNNNNNNTAVDNHNNTASKGATPSNNNGVGASGAVAAVNGHGHGHHDHDSVGTPQSTKFESVWLSSPEPSPAPAVRASVAPATTNNMLPPPPPTTTSMMLSMTMPKISGPTFQLDERLLQLERQQELAQRAINEQKQKIYHHYQMYYNNGSNNNNHNNGGDINGGEKCNRNHGGQPVPTAPAGGGDGDDTLFDFREIEREEEYNVPLYHNKKGNNDNDEKDEILNKNIRVTHRVRRKIKQRRKVVPPEPSLTQPATMMATTSGGMRGVTASAATTMSVSGSTTGVTTHMTTEDDTSTEPYYGSYHPSGYPTSPFATITAPTSLQQRAHQAWKSRQKKNSNLKSKQNNNNNNAQQQQQQPLQQQQQKSFTDNVVERSSSNHNKLQQQQQQLQQQQQQYNRVSNVSFGKSDTVHHFEMDDNETNTDIGGDNSTIGDRSLNSEYTKTMESEVEDMIKDILLIGDGKASQPGRRCYKHKPSVKRKLRNKQGQQQDQQPQQLQGNTSRSSKSSPTNFLGVTNLLNDFPLQTGEDDSTALEDDDYDTQPSYLPAAISSQVSSTQYSKSTLSSSNNNNNNDNTKNRDSNGSQRLPQQERGRTRTRNSFVPVVEESLDDTADESTASATDTTMTSEDSESLLEQQRRWRRHRQRSSGGGGGGSSRRRDDRSLESSTACSVTVDSFMSDDGSKKSKGRRGQSAEDDPFAAVIGFVEGGLTAVSSAIEYAIESAGQETNGSSTNKGKNADDRKQNDSMNLFDSCTGKQQALLESRDASAMTGMTDLAQDFWFNKYLEPGPDMNRQRSGSKRSFDEHDAGGGTDEVQDDGDSYRDETIDEKRELTRRMLALGNGEQVATLAIHAAHSIHRIQGIEYDESVTIDMYKDLKICEVYLTLPLGIVFMENDGGCFVTKVSPDGSAARSGGVEVGDQLASINGQSALNMKVDDICEAVSKSADSSHVDLVFLRYVGPFRPVESVQRKSSFGERSRSFTRSILGRKKEVTEPAIHTPEPEAAVVSPPTKKGGNGFRLFGRGKNKGAKGQRKNKS